MRRTTRLSLATALALVLAASIGAGSASASGFAASTSPVSLNGTAIGSSYLQMGSVTWTCTGPYIEDGIMEEEAVLSVDFTPTQTVSCVSIWGTATIKMNGCRMIFHPGSMTGLGAGTFDIGPSGCGPVSFVASTPCDGKIPSQTGLYAYFTNGTKNGHEIVGIKSDASMKWEGEGPPSQCGTQSWAGFEVEWTVNAENIANELEDVHVNQTGVYMSGKKAEKEAEQPKFNAEAFPVALFGENVGGAPHVLERSPQKVTCNSVDFERQGFASAAGSVSFDATYGECSAGVLISTVNMNGCTYEFDVFNIGPPYTGGASINCPEGKAIAYSVYSNEENYKKGIPLCVWKVGPQEGLEGADYGTSGEGIERAIDIDMELEGLTSTRTTGGKLLCGVEKSETTTYDGGVTVIGVG
jgi:hypothetical protein